MKKTKIVVTGSEGFIGRNLLARLNEHDSYEIAGIDRKTDPAAIDDLITGAQVIFHLAGVNRSDNEADFQAVNVDLTEKLTSLLAKSKNPFKFIISSSTQAALDNVYGNSKKEAEERVKKNLADAPAEVIIYRLPGVFGKWSKPNYNTVIATFCHNVARGIPLEIRDRDHMLTLVYVDDVIESFLQHIDSEVTPSTVNDGEVKPVFNVTLGELADTISGFKENRSTLIAPGVGQPLIKRLYSTYLAFLPEDAFSYPLELRTDNRGNLFEWIKSENFGQIFISTTKPGITRGNHFHHTKTEKFLVIRGKAEIGFREIGTDKVITYDVSGDVPTVVDIPPGYTHNITNVGDSELITLFWANEIFDPERMDTYFLNV